MAKEISVAYLNITDMYNNINETVTTWGNNIKINTYTNMFLWKGEIESSYIKIDTENCQDQTQILIGLGFNKSKSIQGLKEK